jgi:tetratricopeptide (TPR) repeat protein
MAITPFKTLSNKRIRSSIVMVTGTCTVLLGCIGELGTPIPAVMAQEVTRTPQTLTGALTPDSPVWEEDGSYYEPHTFAGTAGEAITIELTSDDFDAYLILQDPAGEVFAEDDDGIGDTNSRITVTLPATGTYTLIVKTTYSTDIGSYQLERRLATEIEQELAQAAQLDKQGEELIQAGNFEEAKALYQQALEIRQQLLASDALLVARSFVFLGAVHQAQGNFEEAETLIKQALAINQDKLGPNHSQTAAILNFLALSYQAQGRYAEAESLYEQALAINQRQLGPDHIQTALSLNILATLYQTQGRYAEAEPLYEQALAINQQQLGSDHIQTAFSLNTLATLYQAQGRYAEAEPLYEQALAINQQQLGSDHIQTAFSLNTLATLYQAQGRYAEAEPLYEQALLINQQQLGPNHHITATGLNNLASVYESQGRYEEAESLFQQALVINQQQLGSNHPLTATSLNNLATLYESQARYEEAESLFQQALEIYKTAFGPNHHITATGLNNLASVYESQGRYEEAESLKLQALNITESTLGPAHPSTATSLNHLAGLYELQGRYAAAEPLFLRSLAITESALGPDHPDIASSLNNLANLYERQGRYEEAENLYQQALVITEQALGPDHPDIASSLNGLAWIYQINGRYREAEPLYRRTLAITEQALGPDHPDIATNLDDLALLYQFQKRYEEAEPLHQQALAIREQALGPNHLATATSLNNLALLYQFQGHYREAELLHQQALAIMEQTLGLNHPDTALSLSNLASLYHARGQLQSALIFLKRGIAIEEKVLSINLVGGSDANKRHYLATVEATTDSAISLHLNDLPTDIEAARLAFVTMLQRKGRILDLSTNLQSLLRDDPEALALLDQLSATSNQLANLTFNPPPELAPEIHEAQLGELQKRVRDLEDQLSRRSTDFAELTASPSFTDIQVALPEQTALVEFIRYRPFHPTADPDDNFGDPHYAAYILNSDGTIQGIDLDSAEAINAAVQALSAGLASPNAPSFQVNESAHQLYDLVMAPVTEALGETTKVYLSPDGALNLIPFEALMDESGQYLVETYQFRYLTSGRDLVRLNNAVNRESNPALLVGNPTYGRPGELVAQANTRAIDFDNRVFPALPGTQAEVDRIASLLPDAEVYTQTNATEAIIKEQTQPNILHIATHGFFEPNEESLNPLLQSGLILAGAASGGQSGADQDGILTALEVTGMNLRGTQLVVLSACETGLGEVTTGEGIYGLRRAFVLAGSQTQVISLWKVDDTATQELMADYYDRLLSGTPRDAALRDTQLAFLDSDDYSHPYYWAAFIGSGDWQPLQL